MADDNLIDAVGDRIKFDRDKLKGEGLQRVELDSFNLSEFWPQFESAVQALSNQVTKIAFMCGKQPFPTKEEVGNFLQDVLPYYNVMRDLYLVLPEEVGAEVFTATTKAVLNVMTALFNIVNSLKDLTEKGSKERLSLTGTFWDACNAVGSLPKNNLLAMLNLFEEESALASDALDELSTTIEEDRLALSEEGWTDSERKMASQAVGLVKVTLTCLQRLHKAVKNYGSCSCTQHCMQLDNLAKTVRRISPALDDFVSELYHPINVPVLIENAGKLVTVLHNVLDCVKGCHFEEGINADTVNKLLHFISHNHCKLDPSANNVISNFTSLSLQP